MKKGIIVLAIVSAAVLALTVLLMFTVYKGPGGTRTTRIFLKDDVTAEQAASFQRFIDGIPGVVSTAYVTKEEALQKFKEEFKDQPEILDGIEGNPLPAEIAVTSNDTAALVSRVGARPEVSLDEFGQPDIKTPDGAGEHFNETVDRNHTIFIRLSVIAGCIVLIALAWGIFFAVALRDGTGNQPNL